MDPIYRDRAEVDRKLSGVESAQLAYDPDTGLYCLGEEPYTGILKERWPSGELCGLGHMIGGVESGASVTWHEGGEIASYCELKENALDGLLTEWNEDGSIKSQQRYSEGRRVREGDSDQPNQQE